LYTAVARPCGAQNITFVFVKNDERLIIQNCSMALHFFWLSNRIEGFLVQHNQTSFSIMIFVTSSFIPWRHHVGKLFAASFFIIILLRCYVLKLFNTGLENV